MKIQSFLVPSMLLVVACGSTTVNRAPADCPEPGAAGGPQGDRHGGGEHGDMQEMHAHMHGGAMKDVCPMAVASTTAKAADVEGGASLTFTTTGDVAELRRRVARMAEKMQSGQCPMMHGGHGAGGPEGSPEHGAPPGGAPSPHEHGAPGGGR